MIKLLSLLLMFIIVYPYFKKGLQVIIMDLVILLLSPIKLLIYLKWKLLKKKQ